MTLQISPVRSPEDHVTDLRLIDLPGLEGRRPQRSKFAGRFAEVGITLSLVHLNVALAVQAEGRDVKEA
ncbi:MAG: AraC family transcriptional regulator, partial [Tardiphaga sp.]